ncbi:MAG TPA: peptidylprolyl isomerase [Flavobacteriales bacterium]|nr:peptidylprolyl isomerase [Flavobacteriales bacterium]
MITFVRIVRYCSNFTMETYYNIKFLQKIFLLILLPFIGESSYGQSDLSGHTAVDHIVATVGNEIILHSEVEMQYLSQMQMGFKNLSAEEARCIVMEDILFQKLLLSQAKKDSIEVSNDQVEGELDRRMRYFVSQIGSEQKLEEYYGKSIVEIKAEFRELVKSQILVQRMQAKTTEHVKATPSEVREFFEDIPKDSLPYINAEIEVSHIVKKSPISETERQRTIDKLEELKERIAKGEDFGVLAFMYSEDPLSAKENGELGFVERGTLVPEFEAAAFSLKEGEVSGIVETKFGYHIMRLIERRGELVNLRHILIAPKVSNEDLQKAKLFLDSIYQLIAIDSLTFSEAAEKFSDDEDTKLNGGVMVNMQTGTSKFEATHLDPLLSFTIDKMLVGQVSQPTLMNTADGKQAYRLIQLKSRTKPHVANLKDDYQRIQEVTLEVKQQKAIQVWIKKKRAKTYIHIKEEYSDCVFANDWTTP